jgi:hypothetical protein
MLFLQSVTKNADKLKDSTESKVCTFLGYDRCKIDSDDIAYLTKGDLKIFYLMLYSWKMSLIQSLLQPDTW